ERCARAAEATGRERRAGQGIRQRTGQGVIRLAEPRTGRPRVSADQILTGFALIIVLAVGSQLLASRLRIPALILLLPAGFTAGALTSDVNPEKLLGPAFQPLVSVAVAVILYDA